MTFDDLSLDRTGLARTALLEKLRSRYAARHQINAAEVVFLPSSEVLSLLDRTDLKSDRFGPVEAPITAVFTSVNDPIRAWESTLGDGLIETGLQQISAISKSQKTNENIALKTKQKALLEAFSGWPEVAKAAVSHNKLTLELEDSAGFAARLSGLGIQLSFEGYRAEMPVVSATDIGELLDRLGAVPARSAQVRRTTKETDIFVALSLEAESPISIDTGIEYFDHMLEQIAKHGGFSLEIACEGDTGVDAHHTIEDVALAFGEALAKALGDRRGIGRFGFELPMDETRAGVWIDLSGRPFAKFSGDIPGERVGEFPVEMTPHVFRSIADSLKAAIHVDVSGENAHHMIEACFKAFGRALRQAVKIEGDAIPSTKGVL
ncbi:imidazoleglycerol-phosphate dehydratase HisB [Hyphobacterium sp.]|uniref:imidazoleglycerol-phosphate dehydratase HisB n=1 Tax=Hyphobacterium sp. TaxID=2004662 RepID=UPI003BAA6E9E